MKKVILGLFLMMIIISQANAQSTLLFQEKCAEGAKKIYIESGGTSFNGHHYNNVAIHHQILLRNNLQRQSD